MGHPEHEHCNIFLVLSIMHKCCMLMCSHVIRNRQRKPKPEKASASSASTCLRYLTYFLPLVLKGDTIRRINSETALNILKPRVGFLSQSSIVSALISRNQLSTSFQISTSQNKRIRFLSPAKGAHLPEYFYAI